MSRAMRILGAVAVVAVAVVAGSRLAGRFANGLRAAPNGASHAANV
jgi:hypothetical protein